MLAGQHTQASCSPKISKQKIANTQPVTNLDSLRALAPVKSLDHAVSPIAGVVAGRMICLLLWAGASRSYRMVVVSLCVVPKMISKAHQECRQEEPAARRTIENTPAWALHLQRAQSHMANCGQSGYFVTIFQFIFPPGMKAA